MLSIKNVSFKFSNIKILDSLSFHVKEGETVALIGTSGSGKTTLLRLICGMLSCHEGFIDAPSPENQSYMSQQDLLLPWRTVEENISLPLELEGKELPQKKLKFLMDQLEISPYKKHYPHQLSGGQYKRAMFARTLAAEKSLLLLDEPFSSLDLPLRDKLYARLKTLSSATTILVTHDFRDAFTLADRILLLKNGSIGQTWDLDNSLKDNPVYMGSLFQELKAALS